MGGGGGARVAPQTLARRSLSPALVRFAAQAHKGRGRSLRFDLPPASRKPLHQAVDHVAKRHTISARAEIQRHAMPQHRAR
jgi:hypothetical protein